MFLLGLDIGTGGSRAVVIDRQGEICASATAEHNPFAAPEIGWAEQEPDDWWRATVEAIQEVLLSVSASEIVAIGLSGQMHGAVVLDELDVPIRPAIIWCDQRTDKQCRVITEKIGKQRLIGIAGNPAVTGFTLPKLLWLRENEPENWSKVRSFLLPKDFIRLKLSGEKASDAADSSGTLLFDVADRNWSNELMSTFEIDRELLPEIFESTEFTGSVTAAAADVTGLKPGTPIVAGAGDNAAGAVGLGVVRPGTMSATIGTSGVIFATTDKPRFDPLGRIHTLCHAVPGVWHNTGVTQAAGLSLLWFRDTFDAARSFDEIVLLAADVPVGSGGALWLPYLMGERTPHLDPYARAALVGLTVSHTEGQVVRAILEGVAFSLRDSIEIFREIGTEPQSIRLGGGGARSPLWREIQADIYGRTAEITSADEGAAFGAAILAGVGAGCWASVEEACEAVIGIAERVEPKQENVKELERNYAAYRRLYEALRPITTIMGAN